MAASDELRFRQFTAATLLLFRVAQGGFGGGDVGLLGTAVHVGKQLPGAYTLAAVERQSRDHVADLCRDRHRLARLRSPQRLQHVIECARLHDGGGDRDWTVVAGLAGFRRRLILATALQDQAGRACEEKAH